MKAWFHVAVMTVSVFVLSAHPVVAEADFADRRMLAESEYQRGYYDEAVRLYSELVDAGDPLAQAELDAIYLIETDFMIAASEYQKKNYELAIELYEKLAETGDPRAYNSLALIFFNGRGVEPDVDTALNWFNLAIGQGYTRAMTMLGVFYERGNQIPKDDEAALRLFRLAADGGDPVGEKLLGRLCAKENAPAGC